MAHWQLLGKNNLFVVELDFSEINIFTVLQWEFKFESVVHRLSSVRLLFRSSVGGVFIGDFVFVGSTDFGMV